MDSPSPPTRPQHPFSDVEMGLEIIAEGWGATRASTIKEAVKASKCQDWPRFLQAASARLAMNQSRELRNLDDRIKRLEKSMAKIAESVAEMAKTSADAAKSGWQTAAFMGRLLALVERRREETQEQP